MLNYKSVRSSALQIRSNPALRHVSEKSGFQKRLSTLLEPMQLPFPTYQNLKDNHQSLLQQYIFYAWVRPAHLRSQWLILDEEMPLLMVDQREESRVYSLRIPFDKKKIQKSGPVVLEGAWDAQDHILYIWDVIVWEKENIWSSKEYSKRWDILKMITESILDCGHPMSDAEVRLPTWEALSSLSNRQDIDPSNAIDFQPEKAGHRKFILRLKDTNVYKPTTHHERKMIAEETKPNHKPTPIQNQLKEEHNPTPIQPQLKEEPKTIPKIQQQNEIVVAHLAKDSICKLPDTYRLTSVTGDDLGIAAIRSLDMSKKLREAIKATPTLLVDVQWYQPFQKYQIKSIHS